MKSGLKVMLRKVSAVVLAIATVLTSVTIPSATVKADEMPQVDGYSVETAEAGTIYTFDFAGQNVVSPNVGTYGLFSFNAGSSNAASKRDDKYGTAFKPGNKLTFTVAGNCYVVLPGDNNSSATVTVTASNGTVAEATQSLTKSQFCSMDDCIAMGANAVVFEYTGNAGTVTVEVTEGTAYMNCAVIIPRATTEGEGSEGEGSKTEEGDVINGYTATTPVAGKTYTFDFITENKVSPNVGTYGLFSFNAGNQNAASYRGDNYGVEFKVGNKLTFAVAGDCYVVLAGDNNSAGTLVATASNGSFAVASKSAKTGGYCSMDDCLAMGANAVVFDYTGAAGTVTIEVTENKAYINSAVIIPKATLDTSKIDAWDFGAEVLDETKYNNNLTVDVINGFFPDTYNTGNADSTKNFLISFTANDAAGNAAIKFNDGGSTTTHRYRTTNEAITRYDAKSLSVGDVTYTGYLYSNAGSTETVNLQVYLYPGDIAKLMLGSNSNDATYKIVDPDKNESFFNYVTTNGKLMECTVYATSAEAGWYTISCTNEKLVCARITRQHNAKVTVAGTVTGAEVPNAYGIEFTNVQTGAKTVAPVADGAYSVELFGNHDYTVALADANGYIISSDAEVALAAEDKTFDITTEEVTFAEITGTITGIDAENLAKLELVFESEMIYAPEIEINNETGAFTLNVERDVTYTLTANNVNDFTLLTTELTFADNAEDVVINFEKKETFGVTVNSELPSGTKVIFTNINEEGYSYTFDIDDVIALRNGQYKVTIDNSVSGLNQYYTKDVKINGAPDEVTIPVKGQMNKWTFATLLADGFNGAVVDGNTYFYGLKAVNAKNDQKKYFLLGGEGSSITVPGVSAGDTVTVKYCYCAGFTANGETVDEKSGSTAQIDTKQFTVAEDGDFVINGVNGANAKQTYFTEISVVSGSAGTYAETIYVGADKEYKTISAAIEAVRAMTRTADQKVTIMIEPGNYEEMLVIDTPNVVLKNASATPSIGLTNKGVDIEENAVRITWYYGHGYTYYSMGSDCKANADLLEVNKANGYASFINPGAGSTAGSYWNATVVVSANNVTFDNIILENSFNQYVSAASVNDVIVSQSSAKNGSVKRDDLTTVGDTKVQEKEYVERAAALAILNGVQESYFNNCRIVGRQDTIYGGLGATVAFNKGAIYGGTDYICGGMSAVFKETDLVFNTNDQSAGSKNDVGYITAAQNDNKHRGYLFLDCHITSTTPGVDTASQYTSKPGYLGRPWAAKSGEAVFINTKIDAADAHWGENLSLIKPAAWDSGLSGESPYSVEYNTIEEAEVDNSSKRASWATVATEAKTYDGKDATIETFLGEWDPFTVEEPEEPALNGLNYVDGVWNYYVDGEIDTTKTGLVWFKDAWWYVKNGTLDKSFVGLTYHGDTWYYIKDGKIDKTFKGLVYHGTKWYYVNNGTIDKSVTDLVYANGAWWYVENGTINKAATRLVWHGDAWYYVKNGKLDKDYMGLVWHGDAWYYVSGGKLDKTYTGLTSYNGKLWYVSNGKLDKTFTGTITYGELPYAVANGVGTLIED